MRPSADYRPLRRALLCAIVSLAGRSVFLNASLAGEPGVQFWVAQAMVAQAFQDLALLSADELAAPVQGNAPQLTKVSYAAQQPGGADR
jgi:hypothetical protein